MRWRPAHDETEGWAGVYQERLPARGAVALLDYRGFGHYCRILASWGGWTFGVTRLGGSRPRAHIGSSFYFGGVHHGDDGGALPVNPRAPQLRARSPTTGGDSMGHLHGGRGFLCDRAKCRPGLGDC